MTGHLTITESVVVTGKRYIFYYKFWNLLPLLMYLFADGVSSVDPDEGSVCVIEGDSFTLKYPLETKLHEDIVWYFNKIPIAEITGDHNKICKDAQCDNNRFRDRLKLDQTGSLTITNTRTTDSGDYYVLVSRKVRGAGSYSVVVQGLSAVDKDEVSVMEEDSVTLHTGVKRNEQEKIKWYFNNIRIAQISVDKNKNCTDVQCNEGTERFRGRLKLDHQTGSLTVKNIRSSDAGLYNLQMINSRISVMKRFSVTVTSSPDVGTDVVAASVMERDSIILNSNVETNQQKKITWFFNDIRIAQISGDLSKICTDVQCNKRTERFRGRLKLDHQTGSLTITNTSTTDSGHYQLEIVSDRISIEKPFSVFVHNVSVAKQEKTRRKSIKEGESVTLESDENKNLNDSLTWYFNDTFIAEITEDQSKICTDDQCKERFRDRLKLDHQNGSLTITNMRTSDSGWYNLTIKNIRFSTIKSFKVNVTAAVKETNAVAVVVSVLLLVALAAAVIYLYTHPQNSCVLCKERDNPRQHEQRAVNSSPRDEAEGSCNPLMTVQRTETDTVIQDSQSLNHQVDDLYSPTDSANETSQ